MFVLHVRKSLAKLATAVLTVALVHLCAVYYTRWHNVDLAVNFMKAYECDWVSTKECVSYKDLYINSMSELLLFPIFITVLLLALGWILHEV